MPELDAADTAAQGQPTPEQAELFEIADTPAAAPEATEGTATGTVSPTQPETLIFGKYRSIEEAEGAYKEAQRKMHEEAQARARYERILAERQTATPPQPPIDPASFEEKFRERLADNPAETMASFVNFILQKNQAEQMQRQQAMMQRFQQFATNPEYADVAQDVAQQLPFSAGEPIDPVEATFLRASNARMRQMLMAQRGAPQTPPFVESGRGSRQDAEKLTLELEDAARIRSRYSDQRLQELGRMVAKVKADGGNMRGMNIDEYERVK